MLRKILVYAALTAFLACTTSIASYAAAEGNTPPGQPPDQGTINAFIYHHFGKQDQYPSTSVSDKQFKEHLKYLEKNDYSVMTLGDALDLLYSEDRLPEKTAVITIDDGYRSIRENAVPLLDKYGYRATIFVPTSHVGGGNYLTWGQIAELQKKGFEIGNHSHSHEYFLNHPKGKIAEKFEEDLKKSHKLFEQHLGGVPDLYAYPFGEYNPEMTEVLKKHGYRAAAAQKSGVICTESNQFALPRFPMNLNYGKPEDFAEKLRMNPLRVVKAEPSDPVVVSGQNPPKLELTVKNSEIYSEGLQCFVGGKRNCSIEHTRKKDRLVIRVSSTDKLASRRTLYTVTASSEDGSRWFWYSHLWIIPEYGE